MNHHYMTTRPRQGGTRFQVGIAILGALLAIVVRWYYVSHAQVYQPLEEHTSFGGAAEYYRYAWNLAHRHVFSASYIDDALAVADTFRDPGYPLYLAAFMKLFSTYGTWYVAVVLSQTVLGGVTVACLILALRNTLPSWVLVAIAVAMAWWPHSVAIAANVLSENLTAPLWALSVLLLREAAARQRLGTAIAAGLALAAASLTNSVLTPLVVLLALVFAWKKVMSPRLLMVLAISALVPLGAWGIRNSQVPATLSSSYRVEVNLVQGSWPTYHMATQLEARHDPVGIQTTRAINAEIDAVQANPAAGMQLMAKRMGEAPATYAAWYLSKPALLWGWQIGLGAGEFYAYPTHNSPFIVNPAWRVIAAVAFITNSAFAALALAGLVIALCQRGSTAPMLALALTAGWVTLVYSVLQADPRYSIPFRGAEITLALFAVWTAAYAARQRRVIATP